MDIKQDIICFSKEIGLDKVGFTTAKPFLQEKEVLLERKAKNLISPFEEQDIEIRCNPEKSLPGAKTIICFAMGYLIYPQSSLEVVSSHIESRSRPEGKISRYAQVKDYHVILTEKLRHVVDFISKKRSGRFKIIVDTGSLIEKAAARRAGLGWIGENTCFFTPELGSWIFLGEILTDIEIEPDSPIESNCNGCGSCVSACPTGALTAPFQINPYRCLSYITQMRGHIPEEFRKVLGDRIFGCDTCQEVCPCNQKVKIPNHKEFIPDIPVERDLEKLAILSKQDFNMIFNNIAAGWRGRNVIRRNAVCALGNLRNENTRKLLDTLTKDPSEIVREQARWSLQNYLCR